MGKVRVVDGIPVLWVYERALASGAFEVSILEAKYMTSEAVTWCDGCEMIKSSTS